VGYKIIARCGDAEPPAGACTYGPHQLVKTSDGVARLIRISSMPNIFHRGLFDGRVAIIITSGGSSISPSRPPSRSGELGARIAICGRKKENQRGGGGPKELKALRRQVFADACDIREEVRADRLVRRQRVKAKLGTRVDPGEKQRGRPSSHHHRDGDTARLGGQWSATTLNGTFFADAGRGHEAHDPREGRIVNVIANVARGFPGMVPRRGARASNFMTGSFRHLI
jgi:citronellol/citronellal dehydrogenase